MLVQPLLTGTSVITTRYLTGTSNLRGTSSQVHWQANLAIVTCGGQLLGGASSVAWLPDGARLRGASSVVAGGQLRGASSVVAEDSSAELAPLGLPDGACSAELAPSWRRTAPRS